jgi:hypothetical protein
MKFWTSLRPHGSDLMQAYGDNHGVGATIRQAASSNVHRHGGAPSGAGIINGKSASLQQIDRSQLARLAILIFNLPR